MADIFREVDEDLRRDRLGRLWKRFAPYVIGVAVLIVVGTAGYRGWEAWQQSISEEAGDAFLAALETAEKGEHDAAREALAGMTDATGGYPMLARMRAASELAQSGDTAGAVKAFDAIAADTSIGETQRELASLRAAYLALDAEERAAVEARVSALNTEIHPMRHSAREILALAAWKAGDLAAAQARVDEILADTETPSDVTIRARVLQSLLQSAGAAAAAPGQTKQ